jgi:hypothetical protein
LILSSDIYERPAFSSDNPEANKNVAAFYKYVRDNYRRTAEFAPAAKQKPSPIEVINIFNNVKYCVATLRENITGPVIEIYNLF